MNRVIQNNFTGGLLSDVLLGRTDLNKYGNGLEECTNFIPQVYGGVKTRPGLKYIGSLDDLVDGQNCRLIPFVFSFSQSYILVFTHLKMRIIKDGGFVVYPEGHPNAGDIVEIDTIYNQTQIHNLRHTQITDTMYITHPFYTRAKLQRSDHHVWTFTIVAAETIDAPTITAVVGDEGSGSGKRLYIYFVTAVRADGLETVVDFDSGTPAILQSVYVTHPWPEGKTVGIQWDAVAGAVTYRVYKWSGTGYGLVAETTARDFVDDNIRPSSVEGYVKPSPDFNAANRPPLAVGMYQQRIFYGGSNIQPQTVFGSQTALLDNFSVSSFARDTDAVQFTLFSELSERILHFVSLEKLFVFTSESEKILEAGAGSEALTPTSVNVKTRSRLGCSDVRPQVIGGDVVFVHRSGERVYNLFYSLEADGFDTMELTMLVPGLFTGSQILDWAWNSTDLILWVVTKDGKLFTLTYDRKQQVWAWAKHVTDGKVLSVGRVESRNGSDTYIAVQRHRVLGGIVQHTFQIEQVFEGDRTNPKTCFCVDSGLTYTGSPATIISGLDHLIGREVSILANGGVENKQVVDGDGRITLDAPATHVAVGLPFSCVARPTRLNVNAGTTTIQNMPKLISNIALRVINTRGLTVSTPNDGRTTPIEVKPRRNEPYAEPSQLQNGDVRLATFGSWSRDGYIELRQDNPLPAHVTAIVAEVELED